MARHTRTNPGRPWSGTPEEFVRLARDGQRIVQAATDGDVDCRITVYFGGATSSKFESPEEFLENFAVSDIPKVTGVSFTCSNLGPRTVRATVTLPTGIQNSSATVDASDLSLCLGMATRLAELFEHSNARRQGLRQPGSASKMAQLREHSGKWFTIIVTAAITAAVSVAVTIWVTKLLT